MSDRYMIGPFVVESISDSFLTGYRYWLPDRPEQVGEAKSARELGDIFEQICADYLAQKASERAMTVPSQFAEIMRRSRLSERDEANGCNLLWAEKDRRALIALVREARSLLQAHVLDECAEDQDTCYQGADCTCAKVCQFMTRTEEP